MKLLITGGAGFIGSNFIHLIIKERPDYKMVNVDALTYCGNLSNLSDIEEHSNYQFVKPISQTPIHCVKVYAS